LRKEIIFGNEKMIVRVKAQGAMCKKVVSGSGGEMEISLSDQARVGDLLTELGFRPEDGIIVTLDNRVVKAKTPLYDRSLLQLYDPIGGG
jgi:sulfur carrier protein ThiS